VQARGDKPKLTDNEEVGKVATIERERRNSLLCEVRNGESKWSHRAQTDLVKRKQHATLLFTFITNLLARSASHRTNRCIVTASDSRGDKRKDSVCVCVSRCVMLASLYSRWLYLITMRHAAFRCTISHLTKRSPTLGTARTSGFSSSSTLTTPSWTFAWSSRLRLLPCDMCRRY
jgi:hypothetical protein